MRCAHQALRAHLFMDGSGLQPLNRPVIDSPAMKTGPPPVTGMLVLELSTGNAGQTAGMLLADLGAQIWTKG